jgi:hypothetical protein
MKITPYAASAFLGVLVLAGCAQQGVPSISIDCTGFAGRDCGSVAETITTSGAQTPSVTATIPLSAAGGGLGALAEPADSQPGAMVVH